MIYSRLRLVRLSCYWLDTKNEKIIRERQWKTLLVLKSSTLEIRLKVNDRWKSRFYRAFQNSEVLSTRKATWCWFIRKEALILNCSKFHLIFPYDFRVRLPKYWVRTPSEFLSFGVRNLERVVSCIPGYKVCFVQPTHNVRRPYNP